MPDIKKRYRLIYGVCQLLDKIVGRSIGKKLTPRTRKYIYDKVESDLKSKGKRTITRIESTSNITAANLKKNYIDKGIPVVAKGAALEWDCCKNWSLDYFSKLYGEKEVTIVGNDTGENSFEVIKLKDVINNLNSETKKYLRFYPFLTQHPEHVNDFDLNWLRKAKGRWKTWEKFQMFIGGEKSGTPMHNAMASNLFIQVFGSKDWILYPPEVSMIVDPSPGKNFHRSAPFKSEDGPFDPFKSEFDPPYHLYENVDAFRVLLEPGDILYNPPHYWHAIQNPTDSIGIGYRWLSTSQSFKTAPFYTILDILAAPFNKHIYKDWNKDYFQMLLMERGLYKKYLSQRKK